jgi:glycosyltransferase involved in cell wall biosynthesis
MGAALEFIESGKNGWLIPADDEEAVFNAMRQAVSLSAPERAGLGRCAQESVSGHSLQQGAVRFKQYSSETVANWQA